MSYFANIWSGIKTTAQGLSLSKQYFGKGITKGVYTLQYPDENLPIDPVTHRGIHEYDSIEDEHEEEGMLQLQEHLARVREKRAKGPPDVP